MTPIFWMLYCSALHFLITNIKMTQSGLMHIMFIYQTPPDDLNFIFARQMRSVWIKGHLVLYILPRSDKVQDIVPKMFFHFHCVVDVCRDCLSGLNVINMTWNLLVLTRQMFWLKMTIQLMLSFENISSCFVHISQKYLAWLGFTVFMNGKYLKILDYSYNLR